MGRTSISWTDHTINPGIYGCSPAGPGCRNCYAARLAPRLVGQGLYPEGVTQGQRWTRKVMVDRDRIKPAFAKLPKKKAARVFVTSMGDLFHEAVPFEFIAQVLEEVARRPHLTFLLLTKRPQQAYEFWKWQVYQPRRPTWPENAWLGISCSTQADLDRMAPVMIDLPAWHFLSLEPLLERITVARHLEPSRIRWVIVGGESGPGARPTHPAWVRGVRDECVGARVPFHFKQWGEWGPIHGTGKLDGSEEDEAAPYTWLSLTGERHGSGLPPDALMLRQGAKRAGRLLDGQVWHQVPEVIASTTGRGGGNA